MRHNASLYFLVHVRGNCCSDCGPARNKVDAARVMYALDNAADDSVVRGFGGKAKGLRFVIVGAEADFDYFSGRMRGDELEGFVRHFVLRLDEFDHPAKDFIRRGAASDCPV